MRRESLLADEGFSLLEVLVASTILTVALVALAQVLALATAANAAARRTTYAAVLAAQRQEMLRALPWDSLQGELGQSVDYLDRGGALTGARGAAVYVRESFVEPLPQDPGNLLHIRVVVRSAREGVELATTRTRRSP